MPWIERDEEFLGPSRPGGARRRGRGRPKGIRRTIVIVHPVLRCPKCGAKTVERVKTSLPLREYRCLSAGCGVAFRTIEED